jgi:type III pantothenate kinase
MILLLDIGNTNTHVGLGNAKRVLSQTNLPTEELILGKAGKAMARFLAGKRITGAAISSVVPRATRPAIALIQKQWQVEPLVLTAETVTRIGVSYPKPESIGPDRLANAAAARVYFGAPAVVVDFGTAVTFDVVDRAGNYIGGIIAPGLAVMTGYLHEKTALLPRIEIRETEAAVGKSTEEAMLIGAVQGYRGLIRELITRLKKHLKTRSLPVVATGGYAGLMARGLPEITAVEPLLTLEGLRIVQSDQKNRGFG